MSPRERESSRVRLKPADSFDLIRLIARSQSDPRKALAELVQNSLDAGARTVRVTWFSQKGRRAVSVADDGRGVFPEMERRAALQRIATSLGASHKAQLSAAQRHEWMTAGKYGIGLLGFWSVGKWMEIRTRVAGSDLWTLRLEEEGRDGEVARARAARLPLPDETITEVVISDVHDAAEGQVKPKRLAAYLAGELRGQLLGRDVRLEIHDHVSRGRAAKRLVVRPQKFRGAPVTDVPDLEVPGFATARVELYLLPDGDPERGRVALACGGTTVLDDLAEIDGVIEAREPWSLGRLEGVVDFPDLEVAPGTRRGIVPNAAAKALRDALPALETRVRAVLAQDAQRREEERHTDDARELRRVFRGLPKLLPHYDLFVVRDGGRETPSSPAQGGVAESPAVPDDVVDDDDAPSPDLLFEPGPLARVEIRPRRSEIPAEGSRRLRAVALDADGRPAAGDVVFTWRLVGGGAVSAVGAMDAARVVASYTAPDAPCEATVHVEAVQGGTRVEATATICVTDAGDAPDRGGAGIPDPEGVTAPGDRWRSRIEQGRWQYNTGHPDYLHVRDDPRRRFRYLVHLFAKELALRNFADNPPGDLLERMVQVLTYVGDVVRPKPATRKPDAR